MAEEKEKRKVGERRSAQRIKRVLADTTPKHLEQLTKQARALTGDDGEADYQDSSIDAIRGKLGHLQKRHTVLREKLTNPSPPQKSLVSRLQAEFEKEIEGKRLEGDDWNDSVIKELQERLYSGDAAGSAQDDQEANGQLQTDDGRRGEEDLTLLVNRKVIRGVKGGHIIIRFDTAYEDKNFESYYCVLKSNLAMDKLHVIEHTIPFFLPVRELEKQHLGNSPKMFIDYMGDVLQAYVSRREQVNELKKFKGDLIGQLYHSLSYTLIEIMLKEPQCQVGLSLAYHNSDSELPTQSTITAWPLSSDLITQTAAKRPGRAILRNSTAFRLPKAEAFLRTMPLPRGFAEFLTDLRDTLGLSPPVLAIEAPVLTTENPQLAIEAPVLPTETPQLAIEASVLPTETPQLGTETPQLATETPESATETPQLAIEASVLPTETPQLATETPQLATETPHLATETPQLATETPQLVTETPQLVTETPQLATETSQLATEASQLVVETPQLAIEAQPMVSGAESMLSGGEPMAIDAEPMVIEAPMEAAH